MVALRESGGGEGAAVDQSLDRLQRVKPVFELFVGCIDIETVAVGVTEKHVFLPGVVGDVDAFGVELLEVNDGRLVSCLHSVVENIASAELSSKVVVKYALAGLIEVVAVGFSPNNHGVSRFTGQLDQAVEGLVEDAGGGLRNLDGYRRRLLDSLTLPLDMVRVK